MERSSDESRHSADALIFLTSDLLLAVCAFVELGFVVPVFGKVYLDFAHTPPPTQTILNISNAIMAFHGLGFGILFCLTLWMIIRMYLDVQRRGDRKALFLRLWIIFFSFVLLMGIMTIMMFIPIFKNAGGIVNG